MHSNFLHQPAWRRAVVLGAGAVAVVPAVFGAALPASSAPAGSTAHPRSPASPPGDGPVLVGRAVLPALTFAGPPASGAAVLPGGTGTLNGVSFPLPAQPVEGFSAVDRGRRPGEFLAMEDNGFGNKTNSRDFLTRAYYVRPHFKTAAGGSGAVEVKKHISFRDPHHLMGFPIVNEGTKRRLLTGADIDPESMQRGRHHDLWVGEEFGPWILHFDLRGRLLDPPFPMPDGIRSPDNPQFDPKTATQPSSRGIEGMAISPDGKFLYASLEGATNSDPDQTRRLVFVFSAERKAFTGEVLHYRTEAASNLVADMWALDAHRLVVIERDRGSGVTALFRRLYLVDLRHVDSSGFLEKTLLVDLARIPDPNLVSLPAIHPGDLGLGDPFSVMCESVEAVHHIAGDRLLVGCDNNLPNTGRNPGLADDNEFITVDVPQISGTSRP